MSPDLDRAAEADRPLESLQSPALSREGGLGRGAREAAMRGWAVLWKGLAVRLADALGSKERGHSLENERSATTCCRFATFCIKLIWGRSAAFCINLVAFCCVLH